MLRPKNAQMIHSHFWAWHYYICSFTELVIAETKIYCWFEKKQRLWHKCRYYIAFSRSTRQHHKLHTHFLFRKKSSQGLGILLLRHLVKTKLSTTLATWSLCAFSCVFSCPRIWRARIQSRLNCDKWLKMWLFLHFYLQYFAISHNFAGIMQNRTICEG